MSTPRMPPQQTPLLEKVPSDKGWHYRMTQPLLARPTLVECYCGRLVLACVTTTQEVACLDPKTGKQDLVKVPMYRLLPTVEHPVTGIPHICEGMPAQGKAQPQQQPEAA